MAKINGFKAYDIRGKVPGELNTDLAYKIGRVYSKHVSANKIVVGRDVRKSSDEISEALIRGINDSGADVIDIGLCGTEMVYFATPHFDADGGIMITASHNPPEYNGMKFVKRDSVPVGYDSGLNKVEQMIIDNNLGDVSEKKGTVRVEDVMGVFIENLNQFYDPAKIDKLKIVVNGGNGCVGAALDAIEDKLPIEMIKVFTDPDSDFPNGSSKSITTGKPETNH